MGVERDAPELSRRGVFRRLLGGVAGLFALLWGVPGAATLLSPLRGGGKSDWRRAMALAQLVEGVPTPFVYEIRAGWEVRKESLLLVRRGEEVIALSTRCTHLGCRVRPKREALHCPCHGGVFDLAGAPMEGPVTEPLARIETRIADGHIEVKV